MQLVVDTCRKPMLTYNMGTRQVDVVQRDLLERYKPACDELATIYYFAHVGVWSLDGFTLSDWCKQYEGLYDAGIQIGLKYEYDVTGIHLHRVECGIYSLGIHEPTNLLRGVRFEIELGIRYPEHLRPPPLVMYVPESEVAKARETFMLKTLNGDRL